MTQDVVVILIGVFEVLCLVVLTQKKRSEYFKNMSKQFFGNGFVRYSLLPVGAFVIASAIIVLVAAILHAGPNIRPNASLVAAVILVTCILQVVAGKCFFCWDFSETALAILLAAPGPVLLVTTILSYGVMRGSSVFGAFVLCVLFFPAILSIESYVRFIKNRRR